MSINVCIVIIFQPNFLKELFGRKNYTNIFKYSESEFNEFKTRLKSIQNRFKLSAVLNLEKFSTILSGTNHI